MSSLAFRFPRFFVTSPAPCPYLPGRIERKVFTELRGEDARDMNESLGRLGFRRSQSVVYRPSCDGCQACVSVRVPVAAFEPSESQRRAQKRNADLLAEVREPWTTDEQFQLLRRYLAHRHPTGGMAGMDALDYADMVEQTPVDTLVIEYREPAAGRDTRGRLIAACIADRHDDGLSLIYSFYEPAMAARGLGTYVILDQIARARAAELGYVYLGYWINGAPRMAYKASFRPLEQLTREGWVRLPEPASLRAAG